MAREPVDRAASVAARLRNVAAARGIDLAFVLHRYAVERLLHRLALSPARDRFVLKGAMLFMTWLPDPLRATRDVDLLGEGDGVVSLVADTFRMVCAIAVDDGVVFDVDSLDARVIRGRLEAGGVRVTLTARLGRSRIPVQIDIGFGDAVTPPPSEIEFPALLDGPGPRIRAYRKETVVAEKLHAVVAHGIGNSRLKDFYDLTAIARLFPFDGEPVAAAIAATFAARGAALPRERPTGLTPAFADDPQKLAQWQAFTRRQPLLVPVGELAEVIDEISLFVMPPLTALTSGDPFTCQWQPGGPWRRRRS
jgi:predicted nucleotidyltransferase component of viral defense system